MVLFAKLTWCLVVPVVATVEIEGDGVVCSMPHKIPLRRSNPMKKLSIGIPTRSSQREEPALVSSGGGDIAEELAGARAFAKMASAPRVVDSVSLSPLFETKSLWQTQDMVHEQVELPGLARFIIDHPIFFRLRFIKQLGVASYVYIGATHTRHAHSIGTAYLAVEFMKNLERDLHTKSFTRSVDDSALVDPNFRFGVKDFILVMFAALCHDLGHPAYSHTFEVFMHKNPKYASWHHETASQLLVNVVWKEVVSKMEKWLQERGVQENAMDIKFTDEDLRFIQNLIDPPKKEMTKWYKEGTLKENWNEMNMGRPFSHAFMYEIVSNWRGGFDVDRLDYFMRDTLHLGMKLDFSAKMYLNDLKLVRFKTRYTESGSSMRSTSSVDEPSCSSSPSNASTDSSNGSVDSSPVHSKKRNEIIEKSVATTGLDLTLLAPAVGNADKTLLSREFESRTKNISQCDKTIQDCHADAEGLAVMKSSPAVVAESAIVGATAGAADKTLLNREDEECVVASGLPTGGSAGKTLLNCEIEDVNDKKSPVVRRRFGDDLFFLILPSTGNNSNYPWCYPQSRSLSQEEIALLSHRNEHLVPTIASSIKWREVLESSIFTYRKHLYYRAYRHPTNVKVEHHLIKALDFLGEREVAELRKAADLTPENFNWKTYSRVVDDYCMEKIRSSPKANGYFEFTIIRRNLITLISEIPFDSTLSRNSDVNEQAFREDLIGALHLVVEEDFKNEMALVADLGIEFPRANFVAEETTNSVSTNIAIADTDSANETGNAVTESEINFEDNMMLTEGDVEILADYLFITKEKFHRGNKEDDPMGMAIWYDSKSSSMTLIEDKDTVNVFYPTKTEADKRTLNQNLVFRVLLEHPLVWNEKSAEWSHMYSEEKFQRIIKVLSAVITNYGQRFSDQRPVMKFHKD